MDLRYVSNSRAGARDPSSIVFASRQSSATLGRCVAGVAARECIWHAGRLTRRAAGRFSLPELIYMSDRLTEDVSKLQGRFTALKAEVGKVLVGQDEMLHRLLLGLLAGGHVLLEGVPGLAKTLVVRTLADALDGTFSRIQFTPDMLPGDVIGTQIYNPREGTLHGQEGAGVRQLHPRRRDQPRAGEGAVRAARGDAGAPGHARRPDASSSPSRSSCSRRRTRSSRRAPIRCPRRSSIASCSRSRSAIRRKDDEVKIIDRMAGAGAEPTREQGDDAPTRSSRRARSCARSSSTTRSSATRSTSSPRRAIRRPRARRSSRR